MKKQKAKGLGLKSDTEVSRDINRAAAKKQRDTIKLNDDYRAYCKDTPNPITFIEFKSQWYKKKSDTNKTRYQKPRINENLDALLRSKELLDKHRSEYSKLINEHTDFKKTMSFKEYHRKRTELIHDTQNEYKRQREWLSPTIWDKLNNDVGFKAGIESRSDDMGHYTGSLGKAWGSPKVRYPRK
jgi:hypothetical protein